MLLENFFLDKLHEILTSSSLEKVTFHKNNQSQILGQMRMRGFLLGFHSKDEKCAKRLSSS